MDLKFIPLVCCLGLWVLELMQLFLFWLILKTLGASAINAADISYLCLQVEKGLLQLIQSKQMNKILKKKDDSINKSVLSKASLYSSPSKYVFKRYQQFLNKSRTLGHQVFGIKNSIFYLKIQKTKFQHNSLESKNEKKKLILFSFIF